MIAGMRHSVAGMTQRAAAQEVVANNLANIATTGYKGDRITFAEVLKQTAPAVPAAPPGPGTPRTGASLRPAAAASPAGAPVARQTTETRIRTTIDMRPGAIQATGNDFDFAIDGPGFFAVQTPQGERYTRGGSFTLNGAGQLVTREGFPILTDGGPITAESGRLMITSDGMASVNGAAVGRLKLVTFDRPAELRRLSGGLFASTGAAPKAETDVKVSQGFTEDANVNPVEMLTEMIETMRSFESNQKALTTQIETQEKLVADAGK